MWSRLLLITVHATLLCSTKAFFCPHAGARVCKRHTTHRGSGRESSFTRATTTDIESDRGAMMISMSADRRPAESYDRQAFLSDAARTTAGCLFSAGALLPRRAWAAAAAKKEEEPPVDWKAEFDTVKTGMQPVLKDLRALSTAEDWAGVMEKAREYDLSFRKVKMGKVRKKFPKELKELKAKALELSNDITYDLIAVNKAARSESKDRAYEVLAILETDINSFLELEKRL